VTLSTAQFVWAIIQLSKSTRTAVSNHWTGLLDSPKLAYNALFSVEQKPNMLIQPITSLLPYHVHTGQASFLK